MFCCFSFFTCYCIMFVCYFFKLFSCIQMQNKYVTGFEKTCIVHTSDFSPSRIHEVCKKQCANLKFAGMIEEW